METKITRDFKLTTLSIKNKNTVFLVIIVCLLFGGLSYINLPKELFPEVNFPFILVQTTYPGNPPEDIENLITRPIEKELKSLKGIKDLSSTSAQDASMIFIEFNPGMDIDKAKQDVKDAVDKSLVELPEDRLTDPVVMDIDVSEFPVLTINISGDYSIDELKEFAEYLEDEIETVYEVSKVELTGLTEKEIKINADIHKMELYQLSFYDIESAIASENISMSGGEIKLGGTKRSVRTIGEFTNTKEIENIIVKHEKGNIVYLKDVAQVINGYEDPANFARLNQQPVVTLQVVKKSGENLLRAIEQVMEIMHNSKLQGHVPEDLNVTYTNDQSKYIKDQLNNLENSMIIAIIFVVLVLFFFLGLRNALFVGVAIPLSMLLSMVVLGMMGATINMMVLFSLILALGMLVDNAIVAVENIYRFVDQGYPVKHAARQAVGEIAWPIIASTATTLAAFFPLLFWKDIMGEFMKFLPITLIIVLTSSLFVALVIIPVIASTFIKKGGEIRPLKKKKLLIIAAFLGAISIIFYVTRIYTFANLLMISAILIVVYAFVLYQASQWFMNDFLAKFENFYFNLLKLSLSDRKPIILLIATVFLLFFTIVFLGLREPDVLFFPENEPQYINVLADFPIGTDVVATDKKYKEIEAYVYELLKPYDHIVESVLTIVGAGAKGEEDLTQGNTPNRALTTIKFVDFIDRKGISTSNILKMLNDKMHNKFPGVEFAIEKNSMGPPTGKPINIEIAGKELDILLKLADEIQFMIDTSSIKGIEGLKKDLETGKPELIVNIDRDKARRFGLSTVQIASTIRTALFGKEVSDFKEDEDEYPIQLRLEEKYRYDIPTLINQKITFRSQSSGRIMQVPISAVADITYGTTYGSVRRKDLKRVVTLYSNVLEGYNANNIISQLEELLKNYEMPENYSFSFTGEQKEQEKTVAFLINALLIAISLILIILVSQFNSFIKPFIILASVLFSTIGVFGGIATFKMDFVILMSGIGIISLAGVVVNNAIVLIDYIDFLKSNRKKALGMEEDENLPIEEIIPCIIRAGKTRLRPVLLTAITTILGLLPMAVGLNINFETMLSDFNPQMYLGGDNAIFWGPMAWTVIFGLTFATFLTLVIVPVMYLIANRVKLKFVKRASIVHH